MAPIPKGKRKAAKSARTSPRKAPVTSKSKESANHNTDGTFRAGNTVSSPAGPGVPKKRFDARHFLRRALEMDPADMTSVPMCPADRIARRIAKTLSGDGVVIDKDGKPDEVVLCGKGLVDATSTALVAAYGSLVVQETGDHLAGQAARTEVDALLARADELRRRSRGL